MSLESASNAAVKPLLEDETLEVVDARVGVDGALETPPPIMLTLVVVDGCRGRPSLSKKASAASESSADVIVS